MPIRCRTGKYLEYFPLEPEGPLWQTTTFGPLAKRGVCEPLVEGDVLDREAIDSDMKNLRALTAKIETFADRTIAHIDPRGFNESLPWAELETALDQFDLTACRYIALLTADGYMSLAPVEQFRMDRIFDRPMRKPQTALLVGEAVEDIEA